MSESRRCRHLDVRDFDGLRCCLSCGLAIIEADPGIDVEPTPGSEYQHRPLNHTFGQEIRLVELPPGDFDDELRCNIIHTNLASQEEHVYQAISYTWVTEHGSAELYQHVQCGPNRLVLPILENCANVLRRVRHHALLRLIWIDMICIDQGNLGERNHQVALMSTIYSKAFQVLIYLGEADALSKAVLNGIMGEGTIGTDVEMIRRFFSRRWFNRVWVIQEIAMARSALVLLGDKVVPWDIFSEGLLLELNHAHPKAIMTIPPPLRVGSFFYRKDHDLMSLLIATQPCESTYPRDKMYALLALASDKYPIPLKADYNRQNDWICTQIAAWLTARHRDLRIRRYAYRHHRLGDLSGGHLVEQEQMALSRLPTWVSYWPAAIDTTDIFHFSGPKPETSSSQPTLVTEDGHPFVHPPGPLNYVSNLRLRVLGKALGSVAIESDMIRTELANALTGWQFWFCARKPSSNASKACCQRYQEIAEWTATDEEEQRGVNKLFWSSLKTTTVGLFDDLFPLDSTPKIPSTFGTNSPLDDDSATVSSKQRNSQKGESDDQIRCGSCDERLEPQNNPSVFGFNRERLSELGGIVEACHGAFSWCRTSRDEEWGFRMEARW